MISTHTPLARRDADANSNGMNMLISTHTPLARRDDLEESADDKEIDFYSHASCEARPIVILLTVAVMDFYSHASCEARLLWENEWHDAREFLLTRLLRGATYIRQNERVAIRISTHTPLARRDHAITYTCDATHISTHTPLARRDLAVRILILMTLSFLLTRLLRGATFL